MLTLHIDGSAIAHTDKPVLAAIGRMLMELAGEAPAITINSGGPVTLHGRIAVAAPPAPPPKPAATLDPADAPDAGKTDAATVFGGAGNVPAPPAAGAATSTTAHGAAAVFSGASTSQTAAPPPGSVAQTAVGQEPPASPVPLDSKGLPWDARIHASNRAKKADGEWKRKPKVDDALVAQVTAELMQHLAMAASAPAAVAPPPPGTGTVAPPPPGAIDLPTVTDYPSLFEYITKRGIPADVAQAAAQSLGIAGLGLLSLRADLIQPMYEKLRAIP